MIVIYLIENHPWVLWMDMGAVTRAGKFGEWAWVGRVYP